MSDNLPPLPEPLLRLIASLTVRGAWSDSVMVQIQDQMRAYGDARAAAEHTRMNAVLAAQSAAHHLEVQEQVAAEREACARIAATPFVGEQDDITMAAKDRVAAAIRARGEECDAGPWGPCPTPNACKCPPREGI